MNASRKSSFLAVLLLAALLIPVGAAGAQAPETSAVSAVLVDCDSGRVLYQKNPNEERLIASITKLMTALVAVESTPDLAQMVKIKAEWTQAEGSSLYLKTGEDWAMETLLYGLLLHSGNDAALAIAGHCAGDVESFVDWMNERARDLGMEHTHFQNPNGLNDENHYSTAGDMAKLAVACMRNETIANIVATKSISMGGRTFTNHNKLLWQYEGCVGMKTGFTQMAGRTLVTSAKRNGQTLAVVTLTDPDDWKDHSNLFDYGFETYPKRVFFEAGAVNTMLPVEGSFVRSVPLLVAEEVSYPLTEEEFDQVKVEVLLPEFVAAPVEEGSIAGRVTLHLKNREIGTSYLLYGKSIRRDAIVANEQIQEFLGLNREEISHTYDVFAPGKDR